jgi:hypothetical protein
MANICAAVRLRLLISGQIIVFEKATGHLPERPDKLRATTPQLESRPLQPPADPRHPYIMMIPANHSSAIWITTMQHNIPSLKARFISVLAETPLDRIFNNFAPAFILIFGLLVGFGLAVVLVAPSSSTITDSSVATGPSRDERDLESQPLLADRGEETQ